MHKPRTVWLPRLVLGLLYLSPLGLPLVLPAPPKAPVTVAAAKHPPKTPPIAQFKAPEPIVVVNARTLSRLPDLGQIVSKQNRCLAQAVYFEARGEPLEGQVAVAQVVLNRVADPRYPKNVCGVVFQNEWRRNRCQFSFACDGRSDRPKNRRAWQRARKVATLVLHYRVADYSDRATLYHATYVQPYWAKALKPIRRLGHHVFYREQMANIGP